MANSTEFCGALRTPGAQFFQDALRHGIEEAFKPVSVNSFRMQFREAIKLSVFASLFQV